MNPMNEMVPKLVNVREMTVKYIMNVPRISFKSADTGLIEEIGGTPESRFSGEVVGK